MMGFFLWLERGEAAPSSFDRHYIQLNKKHRDQNITQRLVSGVCFKSREKQLRITLGNSQKKSMISTKTLPALEVKTPFNKFRD